MALNLPILDEAIKAYKAAFNRELRPEKLERLGLTDAEFFERLDLNEGGTRGRQSRVGCRECEGRKVGVRGVSSTTGV